VAFIKKEVIGTIFLRAFKLIQQKQEFEKKRKTWNLKQSQTKVQQARERRTMWKFTTSKETLRSRLSQVFD
jgi:hypothetical protein